MKTFVIDKNIDGLLSALFVSFTENIKPDTVEDKSVYQPIIGSISINVVTDKVNAERVKCALFKYGGNDIIALIKVCIKSCDARCLTTAFNFAHLTLKMRTDVSEMLGEKVVSDFSFTVQKVLHERHIVSGFLRFKESEGGVLYAQYTPDNDITDLLAPHFLRRLGALPFIIHDLKRNFIAISDGHRIKCMHTELPASFTPCEKEEKLNALWKRYYNDINIKERKNLRQQDHFIPRRYRKYAFETWE